MGGGKEICSKGTPKIIKHWGKNERVFVFGLLVNERCDICEVSIKLWKENT